MAENWPLCLSLLELCALQPDAGGRSLLPFFFFLLILSATEQCLNRRLKMRSKWEGLAE